MFSSKYLAVICKVEAGWSNEHCLLNTEDCKCGQLATSSLEKSSFGAFEFIIADLPNTIGEVSCIDM